MYFPCRFAFFKSDASGNKNFARSISKLIYAASFPWYTLSDKIGFNESGKNLLNTMPNRWSKKVYVQGFYYESILFKKAVNMFERMDISESIYKVVVEHYY